MKARSKPFDKKYDAYVPHPRYGRVPRYTSLNPDPYDARVHLHANATNVHELQKRFARLLGKRDRILARLERMVPEELPRVAGTAIEADLSRQNNATVPVTHYYDVERVCRNCKRSFLFFAQEQKYWYETLRFPLDADCVRCPECRKQEQVLARHRAAYEKLAAVLDRDWKDNLKMAESALVLVEHGIFQDRVVQRIRHLLKCVPENERGSAKYRELTDRLKNLPATKPRR